MGSPAPAARESAIDVRLPELAGLVDRWRRPTVPVAARGIAPHVTLLYPWRPAPVTPADLAAARAAVAGTPPFGLTFRRLGRFAEGLVLFLCPEPEAPLRALTRRLAAAFPDTPPFGGHYADPIPHLTVARATTATELDRLEAEVARALAPAFPVRVTVADLAVEEEGEDGMWSVRGTLPLSG
jgi:2'-5' RNA ligase